MGVVEISGRGNEMSSVKSIQKELLKKKETITKLYKEIYELEKELHADTTGKNICDHSKTEEFHWEHDNGYGRQSKMTGKRCVYCGWKDLWNHGRFCNPADLSM